MPDTQVVEIAGRNWLVNALLADGVEVARPERDRGVDAVAYVDLDQTQGRFVARPIQMKAFTAKAFSIAAKYEKFPDLLLAYVWHVLSPTDTYGYCMTYAEAVGIGDAMGYTATDSWTVKGAYTTTRPSIRLIELLAPHLMTAGRWRGKILSHGRR